MMFSDLFYEIYLAITSNKARTGLTILGIVIGIASVITMVSIGQGAQQSIANSIQSIGSNLILIIPGSQQGLQISSGRGSAQSLTLDDIEVLKKTSGVQAVAPESSRRYQVTASGKNTNTQIMGTSPDYLSVRNVQIEEGAFFNDNQVKTKSKVAVLGPTARDDLFGENASSIGKDIRINGTTFKVIGVTKSKGGSGFGSQDDIIFVPVTTAMQFLGGSKYLSTISVQAENAESLSLVQQEVTNVLLTSHHIANPQLADFSTINQSDIVATASSVTGTFTLLLAAIASISLLVGGIGIMNMMITTVTERTREIGLRKAIGATKNDISLQFLAESIVLTFLGGLLGVILGWFISIIISSTTGLATSISLSSVLLAFGVSSGIGILFGYYPAQRAAKMNPIVALRYE